MAATDKKEYTKRILVTGGAGFIGSHVVIQLVKKYPNYFIINLDKLDYCSSLHNLDIIKDKPNYKFVQGDICEPDFIRYILHEENIDIVMNFAAQTHVDLSFWSSLAFTQNNVVGTHVLINAAYEVGVKLFVHVSTDEVYGGTSTVALEEGAKLNPTNPYAASKAAAEAMVLSYWESFKFPVIVTRGNNVYGPHQYPEKVIPKFISLLHRNKKCFLQGDGSTVRNFLHVSDVANAFDIIVHKGTPGQIYNIGNEFEISILQLAKYLLRKMKSIDDEEEMKSWLVNVEDRPVNDLRYPMDTSKLRQLGWEPTLSWDEGMQQTIDWYLDLKNFNNWPNANEALAAYPPGSNTMRLVEK